MPFWMYETCHHLFSFSYSQYPRTFTVSTSQPNATKCKGKKTFPFCEHLLYLLSFRRGQITGYQARANTNVVVHTLSQACNPSMIPSTRLPTVLTKCSISPYDISRDSDSTLWTYRGSISTMMPPRTSPLQEDPPVDLDHTPGKRSGMGSI